MKQLRLTDFKATRQIIERDEMVNGDHSEAESFGSFDVPSDDEDRNY
jgi:hypothetical protein